MCLKHRIKFAVYGQSRRDADKPKLGKWLRLKASEKAFDQLSMRMLKGVASKFGENGNTYEKTVGTRARARPQRKSATASK